MTTDEQNQLIAIMTRPEKPWERLTDALKYVRGIEVEVEKPKRTTRTGQQNRALHLDCALIAEKLESAGIDWKLLIKTDGVDVPVSTETVKEFLFRPVMKLLYGIESTKDLMKTEGQIEKIHETIMRTLGQKHGIEWHDFPTEMMTNVRLNQHANLGNKDYPEDIYNGEGPTI